MYDPGINLSPEDIAVNNRGKRSLRSHLNVSGGGAFFSRLEMRALTTNGFSYKND